MHDAAEAFIGDVSGPLKTLLPDYKAIETRVEEAICNQFLVGYPFHPLIKAADLAILRMEKNQLLDGHVQDWKVYADVDLGQFNYKNVKIRALGPIASKAIFMRRYVELSCAPTQS